MLFTGIKSKISSLDTFSWLNSVKLMNLDCYDDKLLLSLPLIELDLLDFVLELDLLLLTALELDSLDICFDLPDDFFLTGDYLFIPIHLYFLFFFYYLGFYVYTFEIFLKFTSF